jgi:sigma-B regulation protein RsbU (phosphoserine phosphatase)
LPSMSFLQATDNERFLRAFLRTSPYLFAGSAFIAFGLVAAALTAIRRKLDSLLVYFALFATLYGLRMWVQSGIVRTALANSVAFVRFSSAMDFLMPIPAFLFLSAAGLLHRSGRAVGYFLAAVGTGLALITCISGLRPAFYLINNAVVIFAILVLVVNLVRRDSASGPEFLVIRGGLLCFAAFVLLDNIASATSVRWPKFEPIGFAGLLGSLGYVTALRIFARDQQLAEIQNELEVARRMQLSILPEAFPASLSFRVEARYAPMTSVAGDFYDYVLAEDNRAALLIADVSGHGVPAAMIASMVKMAAASQRHNVTSPAQFLAGMNGALCGNTQGQFVTAAYVYLDAASGELRYSAAGHPPMLLLRGAEVREIFENGLMLAAFDFAAYKEIALPLQVGDRLLLYTDGLVEAANSAGEFFGRDRLAALLPQTAALPPAQAADTIMAAARHWSKTQEDDLTLILCDFRQFDASHKFN